MKLINLEFKFYKHFLSINNYIFAFIILVIFTSRFIPNFSQTKNYIIVISGGISFIYALKSQKNNLEVFMLPFLLTVCFLISYFISNNSSLQEFIWIIVYFSTTISLFNNKSILFQIKMLMYLILFTFNIFLVFNVNPNTIFFGVSRNNVSSLSLFILIFYLLKSYSLNTPFSKIPLLLFASTCYWAIGRTGIFIALLTLALFVFIDKKTYKRTFDFKFLLASIILIFALLNHVTFFNFVTENFERISLISNTKTTSTFSNNSDIDTKVSDNTQNIHEISIDNDAATNLTDRGLASSRFTMWKKYLINCKNSASSFLFGVKRTEHPNTFLYGENLHNSFLMLHSKTGILGLLIISILLLNSLIFLLSKKHYFLIILLMLTGLRSAMDWLSFFGYYDILFYYYILEFSDYKKYILNFRKLVFKNKKQLLENENTN